MVVGLEVERLAVVARGLGAIASRIADQAQQVKASRRGPVLAQMALAAPRPLRRGRPRSASGDCLDRCGPALGAAALGVRRGPLCAGADAGAAAAQGRSAIAAATGPSRLARAVLRAPAPALRKAKASGTWRTRSRRSSSRLVSAGPTNRTPSGASRRLSTSTARCCVGAVEVDQQVAAEDDVVELASRRRKSGSNRLPCAKAHLPRRRVATLIAARRRVEVPVAETRGRWPGTNSGRRWRAPACASARALMSTASMLKAVGRKPGVEQRHRHRVRLFAGGARQAQEAQDAVADGVAPFLARRARQRGEGFRGRGRTRSPARPRPRSAPAARCGRARRAPDRRAGRRARRRVIRACTARSTADAPIDAASSPIARFSRRSNSAARSSAALRLLEQEVAQSPAAACSTRSAGSALRVGRDRAEIGRRRLTPGVTKSAGSQRMRLGRLLGDQPEQARLVRCRPR